MKLYKDGNEISLDKAQLHLMLNDGWALTNEPEEDLGEVSTSEEIINEEIVEEKITPPIKKLRKKVTPKIKSVKISKRNDLKWL